MTHDVFISGGTGYLGSALSPELLRRGHAVRTIARAQSVVRVPAGVEPVICDALQSATFAGSVKSADTFIHLTGTPHPAPWKGKQFRAIDLVSLAASVEAAREAQVPHFIYVSVAHPAPVMKAYIEVRRECERILRDSGLTATILRPWYILGPGHRWPVALKPFYALAELFPGTHEGARRLGLVTLEDMVRAIVAAVEVPATSTRVWDVPIIRGACTTATLAEAAEA